jgi:hypothetical protein
MWCFEVCGVGEAFRFCGCFLFEEWLDAVFDEGEFCIGELEVERDVCVSWFADAVVDVLYREWLVCAEFLDGEEDVSLAVIVGADENGGSLCKVDLDRFAEGFESGDGCGVEDHGVFRAPGAVVRRARAVDGGIVGMGFRWCNWCNAVAICGGKCLIVHCYWGRWARLECLSDSDFTAKP